MTRPTSGSTPLRYRGFNTQVFVPKRSTPLDDGQESHVIPKVLLWAMRDHCHSRFGHHKDPVLEHGYGAGEDLAFVLDAGAKLLTIGRVVGSSRGGCTYCLVGSVERARAERFDTSWTSSIEVFELGRDFVLSAVYDGGDGASNVADVERFALEKDVPAEYLPPSPLIEFPDVL